MNKGIDYRAKIQDIRRRFLAGRLTQDQARAEAKPILDGMNAVGRKVAKKFGKTFKDLTFGYLMR